MQSFIPLFIRLIGAITVSIIFAVVTAFAAHASTQLSQQATTRVLFIDLNNAPAEVAAIRRSLGRSAQIDVWPTPAEISLADRKKVLQIGIRSAEVQKTLMAQATLCSRQPNTPRCVQAWQQLRDLELQRQRLTQNITSESLIHHLSKQQISYTSAVVSGHHENGFFEGELARLNILDLQNIVASHSLQFEKVRSVVLLGCDTAAGKLLQTRIRPIFPTAAVLIGAEGPAPTRNELRNLRFIERVFKLEPQLATTKQESFIRQSVANLRTEIWPVAMVWGDLYSAGTDTEHTAPLAQLIRTSTNRLRP